MATFTSKFDVADKVWIIDKFGNVEPEPDMIYGVSFIGHGNIYYMFGPPKDCKASDVFATKQQAQIECDKRNKGE